VPHIFSSQFWSNLFTADLAIDLGTASVLIYTQQAGRIVIYEPSIVALNTVSWAARPRGSRPSGP
jgi:rod shape-determining protein MreB and related proteins